MPDHVHMLVSIPPKISVSSFMGYLKGKSTLMIYATHDTMFLPILPQTCFPLLFALYMW